MPHRIAGRKLGRTHDHRVAMLGNLAVAVIRYERVKTTEAKAKEVRGMVDGMITLAKRGDLHALTALQQELDDLMHKQWVPTRKAIQSFDGFAIRARCALQLLSQLGAGCTR